MVWKTARRMATDKIAERADFRGWHFPKDPDCVYADEKRGIKDTGYFMGTLFASIADFTGATFSGEARFDGATFSGPASFDGATFSGPVWFDGATFSEQARFTAATFSGEAWFTAAMFSGEALFTAATFSTVAVFTAATFSTVAVFTAATFSGPAYFDDATFSGDALFSGAMFSKAAWFDDATFSEAALFRCATFSEAALFRCATFSETAPFDGAVCNPGTIVVFDTPSWWQSILARRPHPFRRRRDGETAYRFAKQSAQQAGNYTAAGRYHYAEQCAIEDGCRNESGLRPWRKAFWLWLGRLVLGRIVFGYGERPLHPLLFGLGVIAIWTVLYVGFAAIAPGSQTATTAIEAYRPSWGEAAYFSVATFTTLGYGDFQPKPACRVWAGVEAMLGATLMAVFVVCLTRKYMR